MRTEKKPPCHLFQSAFSSLSLVHSSVSLRLSTFYAEPLTYLVFPHQTRHVGVRRDSAFKIDILALLDRFGIQFRAEMKAGEWGN